jgi:hypothetical protein
MLTEGRCQRIIHVLWLVHWWSRRRVITRCKAVVVSPLWTRLRDVLLEVMLWGWLLVVLLLMVLEMRLILNRSQGRLARLPHMLSVMLGWLWYWHWCLVDRCAARGDGLEVLSHVSIVVRRRRRRAREMVGYTSCRGIDNHIPARERGLSSRASNGDLRGCRGCGGRRCGFWGWRLIWLSGSAVNCAHDWWCVGAAPGRLW